MQIFHAIYLVDADGKHPDPFALITVKTSSKVAGNLIPRLRAAWASTANTASGTC
jgi:hypothetical protein